MRIWLLDLAEELAFALLHPDSAPAISLDRVWIANSSHAVLLDFPAPGLSAQPWPAQPLDGVPAMQQFLDPVAQHALGVGSGNNLQTASLPLHARGFLASLAKGGFENSDFIVGNLHSLIARPAQVTRATRAASLSLAPVFMLGLSILVVGIIRLDRIRLDRAWNAAYPGRPALATVAELYESAVEGKSQTSNHDAELTRAFIVQHFSDIITNDAAWTRPFLRDHFPRRRVRFSNRPSLATCRRVRTILAKPRVSGRGDVGENRRFENPVSLTVND